MGKSIGDKNHAHAEYWANRPGNRGGGPLRGKRRTSREHKTLTHRIERRIAKRNLRREATQ